MTFRPNDMSAIQPGNPGYRTFGNKTSIFKNAEELELETAKILEETYHVPPEPTPPPATGTASELTITIRDEERSLKTKHLLYDDYKVNSDDPIIKEIIARALREFDGEPTAIRIRISLVVL
jgi:hypothetical protein